MQFIIDHMVSIIVAATVFLLLVNVNHRNQETTVESANLYALTEQELSFIETLKRDLQGVSSVQSIRAISGDPVQHTYRFMAQIDIADTTKIPITYKVQKVGIRDTTTLYQVFRFETRGGVEKPAGASMVTVSKWLIESKNSDGQVPADPRDTRRILVRFEAAGPFTDDNTIKRSGWETTFHPPLLRPTQKII